MSDLSRRRFLTITGGATAAGALGFSTWAALIREQVETVGGPTSTTTSTTTTSTTTTMAPSPTTRPPPNVPTAYDIISADSHINPTALKQPLVAC